MENFLFHYPDERNRHNTVKQIIEKKDNILDLYNITQETLEYCKQVVRHNRKARKHMEGVHSDNYFVNYLYLYVKNKKPVHDILSLLFLKLCGAKIKAKPEDKIVYYIHVKKYRKVNKLIQKINSHLGYFYLFFCGDIKLKQKTVLHTLKYINASLYIDAHKMLIDKSIVPAFVISFCNAITKFKFMLAIEKKPEEFRVKVVQLLQILYVDSRDKFYFRKCMDCLQYMDVKDVKNVMLAWLDVFYKYDRAYFYELLYNHVIRKISKKMMTENEMKTLYKQLKSRVKSNEYVILEDNKL